MSVELQVLTRAREMVVDGWVKGSAYADGRSRRCAGQAITDAYMEVTGQTPDHPPCLCAQHHSEWDGFNRTIEAFTIITGDPSIPSWNDSPARTHGEVIRAFDRAIERLQAKEPVVIVAEVPEVKVESKPVAKVIPIEKIVIEGPEPGAFTTAKKKVLDLLGV